ncbi:very short patch repair endonuclease [Modicisalibacter radicis]|uniref:very short patch repair endonuclease n=1 Tax=Halomonas sp. EAR18 TaxID=2518972 RepID=UPI00109C47A1|nr:very short patch repair endonuclease [Halomonas sp. EAR18]
MVDHVDSSTRSKIMASVGWKNTEPELALRRYLHARGYRFRLHRKDLPGKPDLVLPKHQLAIFVHGCYWHRHPGCHYASTPKSNLGFWEDKFEKNIDRDRRQQQELIDLGWKVLIIWQCGLRLCRDEMDVIDSLVGNNSLYNEWPIEPPRPG